MIIPKHLQQLKEQLQKRNELYAVHSKLKRKLRDKDVLPVHEAENERLSVNQHALTYDDLVILNLDKEVYNDFVEMQRLRDQHKIGGLISPRQRALSIALLVNLTAKPLFTSLRTQQTLPVFQSLLLQNKASFEQDEDVDDEEFTEKIESITGQKSTQKYKVDTTELQHKILDLLGKPIKKSEFEKFFTQKELLLIPLLLSKLQIELTSLGKNRYLFTYAKETTNQDNENTWNYYTVLFKGTILKNA